MHSTAGGGEAVKKKHKMLGHREIVPQSIDVEKGLAMRVPGVRKAFLGARLDPISVPLPTPRLGSVPAYLPGTPRCPGKLLPTTPCAPVALGIRPANLSPGHTKEVVCEGPSPCPR